MTFPRSRSRTARWLRWSLCCALLAGGACAAKKGGIPAGTSEPDKFLFEKGSEALTGKKWLRAREYFRQIVDGYPQSPYRAEAKLGLGDTFLGEGTTQANIQAQSEFKEFLTFFPTHQRADYAQFKLGMSHYKQMARPERDQTEARETVKEFDAFLERFPKSSLVTEVTTKRREAKDRLSESDYRVGLFYFRSRWYPGAIERFKGVLAVDPEFTNRDAVYYHLAESLVVLKRQAEALPYYERLVTEFQQSEFLAQAQRRLGELKSAQDTPPTKPVGR